jgi:competence protein ComEC
MFTDALGGGVSVFLSTLPIMLRNSGTLSFAGLCLNLLVIPAMPVLFVCVFLYLLTANLIPRLASLFAYVVNSILYLMERLCVYVNKTKIFMLHVKAPGTARIIIYTTLVVGVCILAREVKRKMKLKHYELMNEAVLEEESPETKEKIRLLKRLDVAFRVVLVVVFFMCFLFLIGTPKRSQVTFLDVGQGDGIFIRTPTKTVCMIDGGSTSKNKLGENILVPYLEYEGEVRVDYWFLTHADKDHISGFEEVLSGEETEIGAIVLPFFGKEDFAEIDALAKAKGTKVIYAMAGDRIKDRDGKYAFTVLSPQEGVTYEDRNDASLVLLYETKDCRIAFMGDAGFHAEEAVINYLGDEHLTLLKCAHHGSANETNSEEFYQRVRPENVIISCGKDNPYGHPHEETMERIENVQSNVFITKDVGAVTVRMNRFHISHYCGKSS